MPRQTTVNVTLSHLTERHFEKLDNFKQAILIINYINYYLLLEKY